MSENTICKGDSITYVIKDSTDVYYYFWDFGDGFDTSEVSPISHQYNFHPQSGKTVVQLVYWSADSACSFSTSDTVYIHDVVADFFRANEIDTNICLGDSIILLDQSTNATSWEWDFDDGNSYSGQNPGRITFSAPGTYDVRLNVLDQTTTNCADTITKAIVVFPLPNIQVSDEGICLGDSVQLNALSPGASSFTWSPTDSLSATNIPDPIAFPSLTTDYTVTVVDTNTCVAFKPLKVVVIQRPPVYIWDTTIVIGEKVFLQGDAGGQYIYEWLPDSALNCDNCPVPIAQPLVNRNYVLVIADTFGCFTDTSYFDVFIREVYSIDVPKAFTPNGDGNNDIVYVRGWGIKELLEFKIYNRWGQLVFESHDLSVGWDGYFKGKLQNNETYIYTVIAEFYDDIEPVRSKKGNLSLLR